MIIQNRGIRIGKFFIPPFELEKGELLGIYLYGGAHFWQLEQELVELFTEKKEVENLKILQPLTFVEPIFESKFRQMFYPISVEEFIRKNAKEVDEVNKKVYLNPELKRNSKIRNLGYNNRKLLSLYATLSHSQNIVFDLTGQDPLGARETFEIVKENVKEGGSAILIDWADDMMKECTRFYKVKFLE